MWRLRAILIPSVAPALLPTFKVLYAMEVCICNGPPIHTLSPHPATLTLGSSWIDASLILTSMFFPWRRAMGPWSLSSLRGDQGGPKFDSLIQPESLNP